MLDFKPYIILYLYSSNSMTSWPRNNDDDSSGSSGGRGCGGGGFNTPGRFVC